LLHGVKASVEGNTRSEFIVWLPPCYMGLRPQLKANITSEYILWLPPCVATSSSKIPSSGLYLAVKPSHKIWQFKLTED